MGIFNKAQKKFQSAKKRNMGLEGAGVYGADGDEELESTFTAPKASVAAKITVPTEKVRVKTPKVKTTIPTVETVAPTITVGSARQRLMFQEEEAEKWYKGDEPTGSEIAARIYQIGKENPAQGEQLWNTFTQFQSDPSSPIYTPYNAPTSLAVAELQNLGFDMSGGVTDKWIEQNSWLKNHYRTGVSGAPLAPTKESTQEQNAAYWYYQVLKDEEATKQAENEWAALQEEVAYWANRGDRNYSDEEILDRIDWGNYSTLTRMDADREAGTPTSLNRAIGYSQDALYGALWVARGNESTGSAYLDGVKYALGEGRGYTEDEKISAMLDPASDAYSPYAAGCTMDDAALYFGVASFGPDWLENNRSILGGKDATAKRMYQKVYDAEETTLKAEEELAGLMSEVDGYLMVSSDSETVLAAAQGCLDDCPTLRKMDESLANGDLIATTRAVGYSWHDLEQYVRERCDEMNGAPDTSAFVSTVCAQLGLNVPGTGTDAAVEAAGGNAIEAAAPTILAVGTEEEQQVWRAGYSSDFETYLLELNDSMENGTADAQANYGYCLTEANKYAGQHYMNAIAVTRPYETAQAQLAAAHEELFAAREELESVYGELEYFQHPAGNPSRKPDKYIIKTVNGREYKIHARFVSGEDRYEFISATDTETEEQFDFEEPVSPFGALSGTGVYSEDEDEEIAFSQEYLLYQDCMSYVDSLNERHAATLPDENYDSLVARKQELEQKIPQLEAQIPQLVGYLSDNTKQYNQASESLELIQDGYTTAERMRALAGVEEGDTRSNLAIMDYVYQYGAEYKPTEYSTASLYDLAMEQYPYEEVALAAQAGMQANKEQIERLNWVLKEVESRGIAVDDSYLTNIRREQEKLQRDVKDAEYFLLRGNEFFAQIAEKTRQQVIDSIGWFGTMENGYEYFDVYMADPIRDFDSSGSPTTYSNDMTQAERDTYLYLLATEGRESARAYYDHLADPDHGVLLVRTSLGIEERLQQFAEQAPATSTVLSILSSPLQLTGALYSLYQGATGQEINPYHSAFATSRFVGGTRETVKASITEELGEDSPGATLANFGYDVVTSIGDSLLSAQLGGGSAVASVSLMASGAASSTILDAKLRGATDVQALMMGGVAFVAESATEYLPMDELLKIGSSPAAFRSVVKQMAAEGVGEGLSEAITTVSDTAIMRELSTLETRKAEYMNTPGVSESEAENRAVYDALYDILYSAAVGAVSGGGSAVVKYATASHGNANSSQGDATLSETEISTEDTGENSGPEPEKIPSENGEISDLADEEGAFEPFMEDAFGPDVDAEAAQKQQTDVLTRTVTALTMAENAGEASQAAVVGAALSPASPTITSTSVVSVAAQHLTSEHGAKGASVVRDTLLTAAETGMDAESVKTALATAAAIENGSSRPVLNDLIKNGVTVEGLNLLAETAQADMNDPALTDQLRKSVEDNQVATRVAQLVADGALEGIRSYEDALAQAKVNLRNAQKGLETAQARQTATAQNLQSVNAQFIADPANQMLRGAAQQATKDFEGAVQVVMEYQQSVDNAQAAVQNAETTLGSVRDSTMKKIRQQAQEEVTQAKEQVQQQAAEAQNGPSEAAEAEAEDSSAETVETAPVQPEPQLEVWQDPQFHGKVKAAKKLRTNTANFKNWFNDPSGDLTNPDGSPKVIYRGTGSQLYMEHLAKSGGDILNFYSPDLSIAKSYAHGQTHKIKTYDITNWETAEAAMKAEGFELLKEPNINGEWGYRAYGNTNATQYIRGDFYREDELGRFNKEYGGVRRYGLYAGYLSLQNPLVIDAGGSTYTTVHATVKDKNGQPYTATMTNRKWGQWAREQGYDACIVRNVKDNLTGNSSSMVKPGTVIMTFNPSSFKSMWNTGKLGKKTADIRYNKPGVFALTGKPISDQMKAVRAKLEIGQEVPLEEIMATPEVQWAEQRKKPGESVPYREKQYSEAEMAELVTPERASLQEDIREELMDLGSAVIDKDGKTSYTGAVKQEKRLDIVIGPPAAGKSSALADWLSQANGSRVLDSDMVKERLPEYEGGLNSGYLHNESRYIWQRMMDDAAYAGDNVVLPVVGGKLSSVQKNISTFTDYGYDVHVHYVTLERGKTLSRALGRFLFQGRYISPSYLYDMTDGRIDKTYEALKIGGELDGYSKWSNDVPQGQHPILLESDGIGTEVFQEHHGDSGGREPSVHGGGLGTAQGPSGTAQGGNGETKPYSVSTPQAPQGASSMPGKPKKSPQQIAKELAKKLGIGDFIGTRKMNKVPKAVLGYYETRAKYIAVRSRQAGNYLVTMHEIFHSLGQKLGITGTQDMVNNLDPAFAAGYSAAELPGEAFAEFGWRYMANPDQARNFAGDAFVDTFEHELRKSGHYKAVQQSAGELRAWLNASSVGDQIGATIRSKSESRANNDLRKQLGDMISKLVDDTAAAENVDKVVREKGGVANLRKSALMKNYAARRAYAILTQNLTDANWTITGKSLSTRLDEAGITAENKDLLMRYWLALHSLDRDAQDKPVFDAFITRAAREAFIEKVEWEHPEVKKGVEAIQDFRREFMQSFMVDTGFLSQEDFDKMNTMYPHYAPTFRVKNQGAGKHFRSSKRYQIRSATGSTEDIIDPMDSFVSTVDSVVTMVSANNAALAWDKAYRETGGLGEFGREITPDSKEYSVDVSGLQTEIASLLAGNTQDDIFQQVVDLIGTRQSQWVRKNGSSLPNAITVQHPDGELSFYEITEPELYKLLASQRDGGITALKALGKITRWMSALTTGNNPVFALRNFMRDFQNSVNYGSWASNYATGAAKWLRAAYDVWRKKGTYQDYMALGGGGWTRIEAGTKKGAEDYRAALYKGYERSTVGKAAKWVGKKLWNTVTLSRLNEIVEQTSRYAEYKYGKHDKSTAAGRQSAFLASQDVTVDFARSGNSQTAQVLKQVIPFFGASEQGIYRTGRAFTEAERDRAPQRFAKTVINTALMSAITAAIMLKFSSDDEKEAFAWMSDDLKSKHFYLPNFAPDVFGEQPLIRIPLAQDPLTYAVHGAVTNAMWNGQADGPVIEIAAIANTIVDNLNPVSSGSVLQPLIGIAQNENWYGSRIVPSYMDKWEESTQYTEETPDAFVHAGRAFNMSPLKMQYLAEQYTGFLGQMAIPAFSKDKNTDEIGGLAAAIAAAQKKLTSDPLISNDVVGSFYDGYDLLESVTDAAKNDRPLNMLRRGLSEEAASSAYQEAYDLTHKGGVLYDTKQAISDMYREIDAINGNETLTDTQKYELTSNVRREMIETTLVAQEAIGEYKEKYINGQNLVTRILFEGNYAHIPTAMERLDETFTQDSDQMYMQRATSVWEATGNDSALPHPKTSFSSSGVTYEIGEEDWDNWTLQYKLGYQGYLLKNGGGWEAMSPEEQLDMLKDAHEKGHNKAKDWYKNLHGIK